jgi:hypothetical protein
MASRTKSGSNALQIVFTAPIFRATVEDAIREVQRQDSRLQNTYMRCLDPSLLHA